MKGGHRERGFTLVEIMIALAIFATVMIAIYSSWSAILKSTKVGQEAAADAQRSRVAVRVLHDSLLSLEMFQSNIKDYYFWTDTSGDFPILSFVASLPASFPRSGNFDGQNVRRLTFAVEPDTSSENVLVLRQNPVLLQTTENEEENPLVLARNVKQFTLEFWGQRSKEWETEWLYTNQIPRLIRFTLGCGGRDPKRLSPDDLVTRVINIPCMPIPPSLQMGGAAQARPPTVAPVPVANPVPVGNPRR